MKSKEFGRPGGGACVPHAPPRSANAYTFQMYCEDFIRTFEHQFPNQKWKNIEVRFNKDTIIIVSLEIAPLYD